MTTLPPSLSNIPNIPVERQTLEELHLEAQYWRGQIAGARSWGAAVGAAQEFLEYCEREIRRRSEK